VLTSEAEGDEFLLMGLRLKEGVDPRRFEAFTGHSLNERRLRNLEEEGLIQVDGSRLAVTPKGFPVLNAVIAELAA
jgi:oxygen-independent coproporphyrinogen-3 oxidase